jgi:hypothetical protein
MTGFMQLSVHADVPDGIQALRASGRCLVTLTNGSKEGSERLFTDAGIRDQFDLLMSVEDSGAWKPAPPPTRTPCGPATPHPLVCCWSPCTRGTSTAPRERDWGPGG